MKNIVVLGGAKDEVMVGLVLTEREVVRTVARGKVMSECQQLRPPSI